MSADPLDLAGLLRELVQQQTRLGQQQAALLQLQAETVRLQHLLIAQALGTPAGEATPAPPPAVGVPRPQTLAVSVSQTPPEEAVAAEPETAASLGDQPPPPAEPPGPQPKDSPVGPDPPRLHLASTTDTEALGSAQPGPTSPKFRAARYLQPPTATPARPVTRQDVDRVTRLYEAGEAAHLVLQFGEYRGSTLFQVAQLDPDYVRRLALTAQRPQVRAAARQLVVALEASDQAARSGRSRTRRVRADGR